MKALLKEKLWVFIIENNPELMFSLQENYSVQAYLDQKLDNLNPLLRQWKEEGHPDDILEEMALSQLTADLKPSRFHYIRDILEQKFVTEFLKFRESGTLTYEVVNLIEACKEAFEAIGFSEENKESRRLRHAVMGMISEYLETNNPRTGI